MAYPPHLSEEEIKAIRTRRRNNTIAMSLIGLVIVVIMYFGSSPSMAFSFIGIILVILVMLYARRFLEKRAIARRQAQLEQEEREAEK